MPTTMTAKGQVTIPERIRDALKLEPGCQVEFDVNTEGQAILYKVGARKTSTPDRFERTRGKAQIQWRTDELMALLRKPG